ncbi:MAG: hypothetical protein D3903_11435 [Candidatus Electrothrix sp. GM3_4]|nr:hypothetical protein [Candidatus Electrothrix sp. GM3_4]
MMQDFFNEKLLHIIASDRNGYFYFRPETTGRWKITIKDEDGHFVRLGTKVIVKRYLTSKTTLRKTDTSCLQLENNRRL